MKELKLVTELPKKGEKFLCKDNWSTLFKVGEIYTCKIDGFLFDDEEEICEWDDLKKFSSLFLKVEETKSQSLTEKIQPIIDEYNTLNFMKTAHEFRMIEIRTIFQGIENLLNKIQ